VMMQHAEYFPSGETWVSEIRSGSPANTTPTPYGFNAKELDESGLYYFGARYYDPRMSMWVSADPIVSQYMVGHPTGGVFAPRNLNLYGYAWNNPVVLRDPNGANVMYVEPAFVPHDFVGPLLPSTTRLPPPPTLDALKARYDADLRAAQEDYATYRGPTGSNIAGGIFGAAGYGVASSQTSDEKQLLAGSAMGAAVDNMAGALTANRGDPVANGEAQAGAGGAVQNLSPAVQRRVQTVADRIKAPVSVVGSQASGKAGPNSDFDYVIPGANSKVRHQARRLLPRGTGGGEIGPGGRESGIDIMTGPLDVSRPFVTFSPKAGKP
jgi:RHS repeat-associated protein